MNPEIEKIISDLRAAVEKSENEKAEKQKAEQVEESQIEIMDPDVKRVIQELRGELPKTACKFIKVDGRGVYHYMLDYNGAKADFKLAPEHAPAFKSMAMHFLNEVKDGDKKSFLSDPSLLLQEGNLLNADEACAPSPSSDSEVSFL